MDDAISHLYLHAGVDKIVVVYTKNALVTQQAAFVPSAMSAAPHAALKLHVPQGNKTKMFTDTDWEYLNMTPTGPAMLQYLRLSSDNTAEITVRAHTQTHWVLNKEEIAPLMIEDL